MITKLKIDLKAGQLEAEGSEEFVGKLYADFIATLKPSATPTPVDYLASSSTTPVSDAEISSPATHTRQKSKQSSKGNSQPRSKSKSKRDPELIKNLDLFGGESNVSLKDFCSKYEHKTNFERNLIFSYYLKNILNLETITTDHIFTCYRHIGHKLPKALEQSLRDTASDKGWIDADNLEDITVSIAGINHIEHDLPKSNEQ
ncbi:hypothetical protein [Pseudomonas sp. Pc102]|uniref:hypothetical protein n=1 Tax=Pseudomonas sp. Pc102 TaxID=2678261 RepID=UPI001BCD6C94|nr:hypothetical protein [Pseudomonas sp. Pc102]